MPERSHAWPEGHWDWLIHLSHKHGLRCGPMIFVGGQVDKDARGKVLNAYDFAAQTRTVIDHIDRVLAEFGAGLGDVVKLVAFYVNDGSIDEHALLADVAARFGEAPGPAITLAPLPWLAYPGMMVEIEAVAMLAGDGSRLAREAAAPANVMPIDKRLSHGLRCGEMIFAGGQAARDAGGAVLHPGDMTAQGEVAMDRLADVLAAFGADLGDMVKLNIFYAGGGARDGWHDAAGTCAGRFAGPGPVITALPLPWLPDGETIRIEALAMRGADGARLPRRHVIPEGHWDWPAPLPYSQGLGCGEMVFVGGQASLDAGGAVIDPNDMVPQTRRSMDFIARVLAGFGLVLDDAVKINAFYKGEAGPDTILENQRFRSACFREPGPASTGIPLPGLAHQDMMITVEAIAMTR